MKNIYVYCEGQTEETFVRNILYPYFFGINIIVSPIICATKRTTNQKFKGGVSGYKKIKDELTRICKEHSNEYVTTLFDYYGMPRDTPGIDIRDSNIYKRISAIESRINQDIGQQNLRFHLMIHEFEGILFSKPESFSLIADIGVVDEVRDIKSSFCTPEHINDSIETAPSKRLIKLMPTYSKIRHSALLSKDMGIDVIMNECLHFKNWIKNITEWV